MGVRSRPPRAVEAEGAAPHLGGRGARLRTPPATLRRGPDTCPAPQAANPRQPVYRAPLTSHFLHQKPQSSPHWSATWSVLTAPPRGHLAPSPSPVPGLLFLPAPRLGLKPASKRSPPPPPLPSTSRALMQLCELRRVIFGNSA